MSRPIKFRAWDRKMKIMLEFSGLTELASFLAEYAKHDVLSDKFDWIQFTGLHDKNGVEIYEGDVLEDTHLGKRVVEFRERAYNFSMLNDWRVIGNVFSNPELLKD